MPTDIIESYVEISTDEQHATVATVVIGGVDEASASAKVCEPDTWDEMTGDKLALGRALKQLGTRFIREAYEVVHERDAVREQQERASLESRARKAAKVKKFESEFAELIETLYPGTFRNALPSGDSNATMYREGKKISHIEYSRNHLPA